MFKLLITDTHGNSFEFPIEKPEITIGRNPARSDLVLSSKQVSVQHASLKLQNGCYLLKDLNSTNGIYVNKKRVNECLISAGDKFSIANFILQLINTVGDAYVTYHETPISQYSQVRGTSVFNNLLEALQDVPQQIDKRLELETKLQEKVQTIEMLYAFGKTLSSVFDIDKVFSEIVDLCFKLTSAERCAMLSWDEINNLVEPRLISFHPDFNQSLAKHTLSLSRTITQKVITDKVALISEDIQLDERFNAADSIACQNIHSLMCVPLIGKQRVLGVIYADKLGIANPFTLDDLDLLTAVAAQAAIAIDNAFAYDQLAQEAILRANYQRFLPNQVVDLILQSPDQLGIGDGLTQTVTVLFASIKDFNVFVEKGDPEIVIYILNRFLSTMTEIIFAYQGTLDKFLGDGLMALFGAPYQSNQDSFNAVNAAITMQRQLYLLNQDLQSYGIDPIEIGIGINMGEVVVGYIGSEMRMDYTAIGNAVNLAARLMQQSRGQQILISESVSLQTDEAFSLVPVAGLNLKGVTDVPNIFQVVY
ncbi:MAG: GAF domain-containing protein [Acidobacteria bacterium]|nr:GAF domain-containing protein [Acidobacteriota bacterium]